MVKHLIIIYCWFLYFVFNVNINLLIYSYIYCRCTLIVLMQGWWDQRLFFSSQQSFISLSQNWQRTRFLVFFHFYRQCFRCMERWKFLYEIHILYIDRWSNFVFVQIHKYIIIYVRVYKPKVVYYMFK